VKSIVVFQHVPWEILGTFHPLLKKAGFRIRYVNFGRDPEARPKIKDYDGLIVLGGPMGVYETAKHPHLAVEMACIKEAIQQEKPVLGICLGAQLIAAALGAAVAPNENKEIGWYGVSLTPSGKTDPVLGELSEKEMIFQWHADRFDVPKGAERLAGSELCENQAFRFGERVYGFQFHLEVDEPMVKRWIEVPANLAEIRGLGGDGHLEKLLSDTAKFVDRQKELSDKAFGRYIQLFSTKKRTVVLRSGHK